MKVQNGIEKQDYVYYSRQRPSAMRRLQTSLIAHKRGNNAPPQTIHITELIAVTGSLRN